MKKDITILRNHLFDQLNRLAEASSEELDYEINRAASITQVADVIIRTAQVENQFISITKGLGSGFIPLTEKQKELSETNGANITINSKPLFNPDDKHNWLVNEGADKTNEHE